MPAGYLSICHQTKASSVILSEHWLVCVGDRFVSHTFSYLNPAQVMAFVIFIHVPF